MGPLQAVTQLQLWTNDGCEAASFPLSYLVNTNAQLLILTKDKGLLRYKDSATPYLHGWNSYAVGEGAPFAYGAMFMGATAEQAVLAAIDGSPYCNGQVVSMRLEWLYL